MALTKKQGLALYREMVRIRAFETVVERELLAGRMPGFCHLSIGQEAVSVGVCAALNESDYVTSNHRGHAHCLAKGCDPRRMMAELFGRASGLSKGKGGSMHMADPSRGFLGTDGVIGSGFPLACGAALAAKLKGTQQVAISFMGDGATNFATFGESLNLAAIWDLPVLFVVENNLYAEFTPAAYHQKVRDLRLRAQGYGVLGVAVDGMDVVAVYEEASQAVNRARQGEGPTLLECKTYRFKGHNVGDPEGYRSDEEVEEYRARDPIALFARKLVRDKLASAEELEQIDLQAKKEMEDAVEYATSSPIPDPQELFRDVYVRQ